jgi:hypothetical protein
MRRTLGTAVALVATVCASAGPGTAAAAPAPVAAPVAVPVGTSTTLELSADVSAYGRTVRATATVTTGGAPAQGDVLFTLDGAATTTTTKANLTGGGTASVLLPRADVGLHPVTATFVPQLPEEQSGSASAPLVWRVVRASADVGLRVSGARPRSVARAHLDVRGVFGTVPTGQVRVRVRGSSGPRPVRTVALDRTGRAVVRLGRLGAGRHRVVATYAGDARHEAARRSVSVRVARP